MMCISGVYTGPPAKTARCRDCGDPLYLKPWSGPDVANDPDRVSCKRCKWAMSVRDYERVLGLRP